MFLRQIFCGSETKHIYFAICPFLTQCTGIKVLCSIASDSLSNSFKAYIHCSPIYKSFLY